MKNIFRTDTLFFRLAIAWATVLMFVLIPSTARATGETYTFKGRGTAHGVGLDMAGVEGLANLNTSYEDILKTYYTGVTFAGGRENEEIRVGILNAGELQFTADSGYIVYPNNQGPGVHAAQDVITHVTYENGQYVTRVDGAGTWTSSGFTRLEADGGGHLKVLNNSRRYRGHIEARRSSTGLLWAIEVTNLEDYVKGIAEEPNSWPLRAQRTLAVAARTYGLNKKLYSTRWDSENFDIDATMGSQYYLGYDAERPNLVQAVDYTRGKVVMYGDKVIVAAYHGNSGGHTEDIENVWGTSIPYLRGVSSPWGYVYRWETKITKQDMETKINRGFASIGQSTGTLYSIDLSDKTASGRVHKIKITGSYGTRTLLAYEVLGGWLGLKSALVDSVTIDGPPRTDNWDEFIALSNHNSKAADVRLTFVFPNRRPKTLKRRIAAHSRRTFKIDNLVGRGAVSLKVKSNRPVVAERSMYFARGGDGGGSSSSGARKASRKWYFSENKTGRDYDTYLLIMNPRSAPTVVTAAFIKKSGRRIKKKIRIPGLSRREIKVDNVRGLRSVAVPAVVYAPKPIVVERATYVKHGGAIGGNGAMGVTKLSTSWHFAEGFTGSGFNARLSIFNPNAAATVARVTLHKSNGATVVRSYRVKARSRKSINLNKVLSGCEFGISVVSAKKVAVERTVYFDSGGKKGVHSSTGSRKGAKKWYFAEGSTGSGFDELLTVLNTADSTASLTLNYYSKGSGVTTTRLHTVAPGSRKTIAVGDVGEAGTRRSVAAQISSDRPIVVERVMYFSYSGNRGQSTWTGGHVSAGVRKPSKLWLFAEGNTQ